MDTVQRRGLAEAIAAGLTRYVELGALDCPRVIPAVWAKGEKVRVYLGRGEPAYLDVRSGGSVRVRFTGKPDAQAFRFAEAIREVVWEVAPAGAVVA